MRLVATALLLIALSMPVQAAHQGCSTSAATPVVAGDSTFYISSVCPNGGCTVPVRVYEESNGIPGLQRNDLGHDDTQSGSCYAADRKIL